METEVFPIMLVLAASIMSAVASLFLKLGTKGIKLSIKGILGNRNLLIGLFFYFLTTVVFILALPMGELSILYPIMALSYVWVSFLSIKFLREKMGACKWAGVALIIAGVVCITAF